MEPVFFFLSIVRPSHLISLIPRIPKRLHLPLVPIQLLSKSSISIALFYLAQLVLNLQRASQLILQVIALSSILFIGCHVPIPKVRLPFLSFGFLQQVVVLPCQVDGVMDLAPVPNLRLRFDSVPGIQSFQLPPGQCPFQLPYLFMSEVNSS